MVFIPGLTFSGEIFKNQLEYFSSEYRVIAIDPRGQGYSAKTVDGNDYLTHGRDVAGLIDALGLEDIVLIGWSTGNLDTWSYVQQFGKDKLRGVVTIDMSPLPLSPDPKWWTEGTIEELSQVATQVLTSSQGCREFFSEYATGVMIQHKMKPDELEYLLDISGRTPYIGHTPDIAQCFRSFNHFSYLFNMAQSQQHRTPRQAFTILSAIDPQFLSVLPIPALSYFIGKG